MAYDGSIKIQTIVDTKGFKSGRDEIESGLSSIKSSLKSLASVIGLTFGAAAVVDFGKSSVAAASELSNALQGLESIVEGQGRSFSQAQAFIQDYISDGLVPAANAVTAYKNLAARGYDDTQIQQVMTALKDSAAYGRQASLSMGEAIQSASEGLKNENSILVDNAGVTKNVSIMWKDYAQSIGKGVDSLTQYEKIQAEVNGILSETRFQTGDAAKVAQSYSGQVSQLTFNFNNLKVAIGNALIPIVQAILPHINAMLSSLTEVATVAGQVVSILFGTQSQKQEEIATTATKAAKSENNLAKATTAAAKAAKAAASGFDELNIVQSQQSGGTAGNDDTNIITPSTDDTASGNALQDASKVSQEAKRIAEKIQKFIADVKKALNDFSPILEGIATGFLAAFGFKWISSAITKARKLPIISNLIDGVSAAAAAVTTEFKNTGKLFPSLKSGLQAFRDSLSTTQKVMTGLVGAVVVFTTTKAAFKELELGSIDLATAMSNIVPACTVVGIALYATLGPWGLLLEAVALAAGALVGYNEAQNQLQEEMIDETFFDGIGVSLDAFTQYLLSGQEAASGYRQRIMELSEAVDGNQQEIDTARQSLEMYQDILSGTGTMTSDQAGQMEKSYDTLIDNMRENLELNTEQIYLAFKESGETAAKNLGVSVREMTTILEGFRQTFSTKTDELDNKLQPFWDKLKAGEILSPEDQAEFESLLNYVDELSTGVSETQVKYQRQIEDISKINFEDTDVAVEKIGELRDTASSLLDEIDQSKDKTAAAIKTLQGQATVMWEHGDLTNTAYRQAMEMFSKYSAGLDEGYEQQKEDIQTTFAGVMGAIQSQFDIQVETTAVAMEGTLWDKIDAILSGEGYQTPGYYDHIYQRSRETVKDHLQPVQDAIDNAVEALHVTPDPDLGKEIIDEMENHGENAGKGFISGLESKRSEVNAAAESAAKGASATFADAQGEHSPAKDYIEHGENAMLGARNGIQNMAGSVAAAASEAATNASAAFAAAVDPSGGSRAFTSLFNAILDKTDTFCANFRTAINNMLTAMRSAVNGVSLSSGKISVTQMKPVQVPRLATGAVIPPRAEFLAVLGDQRSGRNIETPEALMRKVVREESGGASMALLERLVLLTEQLVAKDTTIKVAVDDREIAQAVAVGNRKLGYPIRG